MKRAIKIIIWVVAVVGVIVLVGFLSMQHRNVKCTRVEISLSNSNAVNDFVTKADIEQTVKGLESSIKGKSISEIDDKNIEKKILDNRYISSAEVYTTNDGCLKIKATQRKALLRVINSGGNGYYLDEGGEMMPLSSKYTPRIIIAHGNISADYSPTLRLINNDKNLKIDTNKLTVLQKLYYLSKYINGSDFWKAMIDQLYVQQNGDIELNLSISSQKIIIGGADNMAEKFRKLEEFYKQKVKSGVWVKYKTINLKYKDQIVCTK